jgi:hypothetical protein
MSSDVSGRLWAMGGICAPAMDGRTTLNDDARALVKEAAAKIEQLEKACAMWNADWRKIVDAVIGPTPMCRDCADEDGTCPASGEPCDPTEQVIWRYRRACENSRHSPDALSADPTQDLGAIAELPKSPPVL